MGDRGACPRLGQPRQQPLAALGALGNIRGLEGVQGGVSLPATPGLVPLSSLPACLYLLSPPSFFF